MVDRYSDPLAQAMMRHPCAKIQKSPHELRETLYQTPYELAYTEASTLGAIVPKYGSTRAQVPWDAAFPPYYMQRDVPEGPANYSLSRTYALFANADEHERLAVAEEAVRGRQHYARKTYAPLYTAFTNELVAMDADGSMRRTEQLGFPWLPRNPTDSDWNEAGLVAKALPPNPTLFTPDAYYMTNSGMPFRNVY